MAKKLDPRLIEILKEYGEDPNEALWDCHGVWVAYHKAIERIAAKADIVFEMPQIIEANSASKTVAIAVKGKMGDNENYREEWSFGEAAPSNNKNAYPYAMAEKRAKDRVVLKLVGLHGAVYSEEEADDFKPGQTPPKQISRDDYADEQSGAPVKSSAQLKRDNFWPDFERELDECETILMLDKFRAAWWEKAIADGWNKAFKETAKDRIEGREKIIMESLDASELADVPLDKALKHSVDEFPGDIDSNRYAQNFRAG